jgi:hypothetical protein
MDIQRRAQTLDTGLQWKPAQGEPFDAHAVELVAVFREGSLAEVRLVFRMSQEVYRRVEQEFHFHLDPVYRAEGPAGGFRPAEEMWIEAALDAPLTARLPQADPFHDAAARLADGGDLLDPARWFACYVFQPEQLPGDMPVLRNGYSTNWNLLFRAASPAKARGPVYTALVEFLLHEKWPFVPLPGEPVIRTDYRGQHGQWICYARIEEDERRVVFYSVYPESIPQAKRAAVAEYLTRINYGLSVGNFEMDFDDGEVRFRTGLDLEGINLQAELFRPLLLNNIHTMDKYLPGILRITQQGLPPH